MDMGQGVMGSMGLPALKGKGKRMAKSKKRRLPEPKVAAAALSPKGVESDVSAAASPTPKSSTAAVASPCKSPQKPANVGGSPQSTPVKNGTATASGGDDPSTWSKSKKKRMKKKFKKEAIAAAKNMKRLPMTGAGGSGDRGEGSKGRLGTASNVPMSLDVANHSKEGNVIKPSKPLAGSSKKRQRNDPVETSASAESNANAGEAEKIVKQSKGTNGTKPQSKLIDENEAVGDRMCPKKKKKLEQNEDSPSSSNHENDVKSPLKVKGDDAANESPKKKKKKQKKKKQKIDTTIPKDKEELSVNTVKPTIPGPKITLPKQSKMSTLQKTFLERLSSSRFRELNEQLYTHSSQHSLEHFSQNPELFDQYHVGFRKQVQQWPVNPVDIIYKKIVKCYSSERTKEDKKGGIRREREQVVVADFGCGDAKLAERLLELQLGDDGHTLTQMGKKKKKSASKGDKLRPFKVFSFDLVSGGNPLVTPADMSDVPLPDESVDVAVYCLALMGTNVADFVREAWRVLKFDGVLRVAEVRSRFETSTSTIDEKGAKRGGKRGKLNSGMKHPKRIDQRNGNDLDGGDDSAPKPLMLIDEFLSLMERCGFRCLDMDRSNKMFLFMDFVKADGSSGLSEKERFTAKPCIYKRR